MKYFHGNGKTTPYLVWFTFSLRITAFLTDWIISFWRLILNPSVVSKLSPLPLITGCSSLWSFRPVFVRVTGKGPIWLTTGEQSSHSIHFWSYLLGRCHWPIRARWSTNLIHWGGSTLELWNTLYLHSEVLNRCGRIATFQGVMMGNSIEWQLQVFLSCTRDSKCICLIKNVKIKWINVVVQW